VNNHSQAILLLDDDPDFLTIGRSILESGGHRVIHATAVDEAWEYLRTEKPCLIITDLMMDALDAGFDFARRLKADERFRDIPVIILTGIASRRGYDFTPRSREDLRSMEADAYLEKPLTADVLLGKVAELMAKREKDETP